MFVCCVIFQILIDIRIKNWMRNKWNNVQNRRQNKNSIRHAPHAYISPLCIKQQQTRSPQWAYVVSSAASCSANTFVVYFVACFRWRFLSIHEYININLYMHVDCGDYCPLRTGFQSKCQNVAIHSVCVCESLTRIHEIKSACVHGRVPQRA